MGDGRVTAKIQFTGQPERDVDAPAWVTVAPPDFAPGIGGIVTLYDVALQAAIDHGFLQRDARPSFRRHILPMIRRARDLRFVNDQLDGAGQNIWDALPDDVDALAQTGQALHRSAPRSSRPSHSPTFGFAWRTPSCRIS